MFLEATEIYTHLPAEIVQEIEDGNTGPIDASIDSAISEAKGYLSNYDIAAIFAATGQDRNAVLHMFVKDITVWHFIQLANPNIDIELRRERYERAIKWLEGVQVGKIVPGLPVVPPAVGNEQPGAIKYGSNPKRNTHY